MMADSSTVNEASTMWSMLEPLNSNWRLTIDPQTPTQFQLHHEARVVAVGQLALTDNHQIINVAAAEWKFRQRADRLEQWCQWHHATDLSLNINYSFHQHMLVIEYLARNSVPTRLDVRHLITSPYEPLQSSSLHTESSLDWQRARHGQPSAFIRQSSKADWFREAFAATQWVKLEHLL